MAEETSGGGGFGDAFFVIGIFALLFFVWVATGGPNKPISKGGFQLTSPQPLSTGEARGTGALLDYRAPGVLLPRVTTRSSSEDTGSVDEQKDQTDAEKEEETLARSQYRGVVSLSSSTSGARRTDAREEYVRISVSSRAEDAVNITGWKLVSAITDKSARIPFGTKLPLSGIIGEHEAIFLEPGDDAYVITGRSPIGASFKINSCIGYFGQYQSFTPSLRNACPRAEDEMEALNVSFDRELACEAFIEDIPRCSIVPSIPPTLSYSCKNFIEDNIHYNGCVRIHQNDEDFFDDEWRVYLGRSSEIWRKERETIRLYDGQGKLVDQISY